ncbi:MAG: methionine adenosyltransferase [Actinomycetota bacterium]|nr:methionine adenosyltransferase [Actinomycetota bacterium]
MNLTVTHRPPYDPPVEFVERKGIGHPDTICDHLAEELARDLARSSLEQTGRVQHFNVDKAIFAAGSVDIDFGGGEHTKRSKLVLVGKVNFTDDWKPDVDALTADTRRRLLDLLPDATPEAFEVELWLNQAAADLADVVNRGHGEDAPRSNDTSFAAVSLPRSPLEEVVYRLEHYLNSAPYRADVPIGRDIKVMGAREGSEVAVTVAVPVLARRVDTRSAYDDVIDRVRIDALALVRDGFGNGTTVRVNQADTHDSQYLTLTGTSAEAGDDGQVGRGNRYGGLITPYRPMSLEATAGKNPAAHVGKTYHAFAEDISQRVMAETDAFETTIRMLSSIGRPVTEPQVVHVETAGSVDEADLEVMVKESLADWEGVRDRLIDGAYELY